MPTFSSRLFRTSSLALALFFASLPSRAADITIDVFAGRHPISNGIYGVTESNEAQLKRMGATMRRMGGNAWSRYNHTNSTTNEGGDGRFYKNLVLKDGGTSDYSADFVAGALDAGMWSLLDRRARANARLGSGRWASWTKSASSPTSATSTRRS